jgi:16S rRNA (cytidine1402-2'-O)-methyltransferase
MGDPEVCAARELTKLHEEFLRGKASDVERRLRARDEIRGEFTLLVAPRERPTEELSVEEEVLSLVRTGMKKIDAIKAVARDRGLGKREVYEAMENYKPKSG